MPGTRKIVCLPKILVYSLEAARRRLAKVKSVVGVSEDFCTLTTLFVIDKKFSKIGSSSFHVSEVDDLKTLNEGASKEREKEGKKKKRKRKKKGRRKKKRGGENLESGRPPCPAAVRASEASERKIFSGGKLKDNFVGRSFFKNVFSNYDCTTVVYNYCTIVLYLVSE